MRTVCGFILILLMELAAAATIDSGTLIGCDPQSVTSGFSVKYYDYPHAAAGSSPCYNLAYQTDDYLYNGGYQTLGAGLLAQSSGVTDLTFATSSNMRGCSVVMANMPSNYNLNQQISVSNFAMLITGYFLAKTTGTYSFNLDYIDDLAYVNVGAGKAFDCCQQGSSESKPAPFDLFAQWASSKPTDSIQADLIAGLYYPIRLFYVNRDYIGGLQFSYTDPSGVKSSNWDSYIFQAPDGSKCEAEPATTTTPWDSTFTSTYTTVST